MPKQVQLLAPPLCHPKCKDPHGVPPFNVSGLTNLDNKLRTYNNLETIYQKSFPHTLFTPSADPKAMTGLQDKYIEQLLKQVGIPAELASDEPKVSKAKKRLIKAKRKMNLLRKRLGKPEEQEDDEEEKGSQTISDKSDDEVQDYGHIDDDSLGNVDADEGGNSD